jgi:hypothetical protein
MKFSQLLICLPIIVLASTLPLYGGNSIFSYHGAPCQNFGNDIYGMSMGDVGVSDIFRKNTGYGNPAMLGNTTKTLFSTGLLFGWTGYSSEYSNANKTFKDNSLDFPFFSVAVPYRSHHFGFQFNSLASGVAKNRTPVTVDTVSFTELQSVDSYIYRADLLYAYSLKFINLGIGLNYYFGHDIRAFEQQFNPETGYVVFDTHEILERTYKNPSASVGITANLKSTALGAYFTKGCTLSGEIIRSSIHETENLGKTEHIIPNHIAAGLTQKLGNEFKVSTDVKIDLWGMENQTQYPKDSWKIGIGFAQEPSEGSKTTLVGQMPKRFGIYHRLLPFEVNNNPVTETALTCGLTLPIKQSDNRLDFGLQYLWRGNLDKNNLQDRSLMFMLGLTGFDVISHEYKRMTPREIPEIEELTE